MAIFVGTAGADVANAGSGIIVGFTGGTVADLNDTIGDKFIAYGGNDEVVAGLGNDTIRGGNGLDTVLGGDGDDLVKFSGTEIVAGDYMDGGNGTDTLQLVGDAALDLRDATIVSVENLIANAENNAIGLTAAQFAGFDTINAGQGTDTITVNTSGAFNLNARPAPILYNIENLAMKGSAANDSLTMSAALLGATAAIDLGDGANDKLIVENNDPDFFWSQLFPPGGIIGVEFITISDSNAAATISCGTSARDFAVNGNGGNDVITTYRGNDTISGGAGADTISSGDGRDLINLKDGDFAAGESINGNGGLDTIHATGIADFTLGIVDHIGTIVTGNAGAELTIPVSEIYGSGFFTISGGAGQDTFNFVFGNKHNKDFSALVLTGSIEHLNIAGSESRDYIVATSLADSIDAGAANDTVNGGLGDDTIKGGSSNDSLTGGAGSDFLDGGTGTDTVSYLNEAAVSIDLSVGIAGGAASGDVYSNIEIFEGSDTGNDLIIGNGAGNTFRGMGGADSLDGGGGNDTLDGGAAADSLQGGQGADVFDFNQVGDSTSAAPDTISGFTTGDDRINLRDIDPSTASGDQAFTFIGLAEFTGDGQARLVQSGADTIVEINIGGTAGAEMRIVLTGVTATDLSADDFVL